MTLHGNPTREDASGAVLAGGYMFCIADSKYTSFRPRVTPGFYAGLSRRRAPSFDDDPIEIPNVERLWSQTPVDQHAAPAEGLPSAGEFFLHRAALAGCSSPPGFFPVRDFQASPPDERHYEGGSFRGALPRLPLSQSSVSSSGPGGCDSARSSSSFLSLPTNRVLSASHSVGNLELCDVGSERACNNKAIPRRARLRRTHSSESDTSMPAWHGKHSKENLPHSANTCPIPEALVRKDSVVGTTYAWFPACPMSAANSGGANEPLCTPHVPSAAPLSLPSGILTRRGSSNSVFATYPGTPIVAQTPHTHILTNQKVINHPPASVRLQRMLLDRGGGRDFAAPTVYHGHEVKRRKIGRATDYSRLHDEFRGFKKVGEGSFAEVLSVENRFDGQRYAVKRRLRPYRGNHEKELILREARVLALISRSADIYGEESSVLASHITRYFGCWFEDGQLHIQTELCEESLSAEVTRLGRFCADKLTVVLQDISAALKFLHMDMNVAHKDVKPDNILRISMRGDRFKYKLCDFGLATSIHENSEACSDLGSGDARYLPREMLSCHADRPLGNDMTKVDIFSLGASALECGIGRTLPPNGDIWQSLRDGHLPFDEMDQLPSKLTELIKAMLNPTPEVRPDADTVLAQLNSP
ncbi:Mitosis inhibitor protein kinase wee1 [Perkinsus chesapeaki]|uniref:Mitosis inhibitor protein kinase wee1 n=1 Tax=Perkinsus chesapeaki TaxID=330153 RepID=A0A7J6MU20_PERCH|nr:Mitosis inhibitor protein kinase wee1 [Perkinsus chesapeaki]